MPDAPSAHLCMNPNDFVYACCLYVNVLVAPYHIKPLLIPVYHWPRDMCIYRALDLHVFVPITPS